MTDALHVPFVTAHAIDLSEAIMLAYRDPTIGQEEFEAIVRSVYGDDDEDGPSPEAIAERHSEITSYREDRGGLGHGC